MENLIEELTKVNPANLSEKGLKLFNKINEIIDRNEELEKENEKIRKSNKTLFELTQHAAMQEFINEDYIPKSRIEEMKLEKGHRLNEVMKENYGVESKETIQLQAIIDFCEELLHEGDK